MKETINELLSRPLWQMNGEEFCQLLDYNLSKHSGGKEVALHRIYGDAQLAEYLGCSEAQVRKLKKLGVFNPAIVPSVGCNATDTANVRDEALSLRTHTPCNEPRGAERYSTGPALPLADSASTAHTPAAAPSARGPPPLVGCISLLASTNAHLAVYAPSSSIGGEARHRGRNKLYNVYSIYHDYYR